MSVWNWITGGSASVGSGPPNGLKFRWGISTNTTESLSTESVSSVIFACCKILSENIARMPIEVKHEEKLGIEGFKSHHLWNLFMYAPNNYQSPQSFWSTIEYHRNYYGNAFAKINRNNGGEAINFEIIHPSLVVDARIVNGNLYYYYQSEGGLVELSSDNMLHFKSISEDGVFGVSPVYALGQDGNIINNIDDTLNTFYKNKATSTMALASEVGDSRNYKVLKQAQDDFSDEYAGPENAGKIITLPPNTKLVSVASNYGDAQMIETLKYKRNDVAAVFSIPLYMLGDTKGDDAENSSLIFRNYTISPIVVMYESELSMKLLTEKEVKAGVTIDFDLDALIEADLISKTGAIAEQVKSGLMTPNEGAVKMGNSKIEGEWGDYHYVQAQYIPLEEFGDYNVFNSEEKETEQTDEDGSLNDKNLEKKKLKKEKDENKDESPKK